MPVKIPLAVKELSFTWKLTINAQTLLSDDGNYSIRIQQMIEFNGQHNGSRAEMAASRHDHALLNWRLDYLKTHLQNKLARAVASLNREAFAFTDFIETAVEDGGQANKQAIAQIRADHEQQIEEAEDRFDQAKREHMRERLRVVKALCEQIKIQYDSLKRQFDKDRKRGLADSKEWKERWLKHARREYGIPDEILLLFAEEGKTAGDVANRIVGLELNYEATTVDKYKKPSSKTRAEKQSPEREIRNLIYPEVYGVPSKNIKIKTKREKSSPKTSRSGGKKR